MAIRYDRGLCIGLFSAKGGVGRSLTALNLAAAYGAGGTKAVLLDADFEWGGSLGHLLGGDPEPSLSDIVAVRHRLTRDLLRGALREYAGEIALLAAPTHRHPEAALSAGLLRQVVGYLCELFDVVVIDLPTRLDPRTLALMGCTDVLLWVSLADRLSLMRTAAGMQMLDWLKVNPRRRGLLLNRADAPAARRAARVLPPLKIWALPDDPAVVSRSVERGRPFVSLHPESALARAVGNVASGVWQDAGVTRAKPAHGGSTARERAMQELVEAVLARVEG